MKRLVFLRRGFGLMYFGTCFINLYLGITQPEILRSLAETALIQPYVFFAANAHISILRLSLMMFFVCQLGLSMLLLSSRETLIKIGILGGLTFHVGILPWGLWSWPNLIFVIGYIVLLKTGVENSIGQRKKSTSEG